MWREKVKTNFPRTWTLNHINILNPWVVCRHLLDEIHFWEMVSGKGMWTLINFLLKLSMYLGFKLLWHKPNHTQSPRHPHLYLRTITWLSCEARDTCCNILWLSDHLCSSCRLALSFLRLAFSGIYLLWRTYGWESRIKVRDSKIAYSFLVSVSCFHTSGFFIFICIFFLCFYMKIIDGLL